jgi:hypothetical protein
LVLDGASSRFNCSMVRHFPRIHKSANSVPSGEL